MYVWFSRPRRRVKMTAALQHTWATFGPRSTHWAACLCAAVLLAAVGCKSNSKEATGVGASRKKDDPLVYGPTKIPRQDLPIPDRAITGPKGKPDPLTTPTGGKAGYSDDPERFKGTYIPGERSTPAALAGRMKDGEELKIDSGVPLTPAGGILTGNSAEVPEGVSPLYAQLTKLGVNAEDRSLAREDGKWVFRASTQISGNGARRQYTGAGATAPEAVRQVLDQLASDAK
jgi:hypothetical protein